MTKNFVLTVVGVAVAWGWGWPLEAAAPRAAEPRGSVSLLELVRDPLLERTIYRMDVQSLHHAPRFAADGAMGQNEKWERGEAPEWFIEGQRFGVDMVQSGLVTNTNALVGQGWTVLSWGFSKQSPDGGFAGTGDPLHSVSLFVEGAARALLLGKESGDASQLRALKKHAPALRAAALWLVRPDVATRGRKNDSPYTHRRYILAAALGETAALADDAALAQAAVAYARDGLTLQQPDGINPEKGGFDVNYQMVGVLMAGRYWPVCGDAALREQLRTMMGRAAAFELTKMDNQGMLSAEGSTRMGHEPGRGGKIKTVNYKEMLQAFLLAAQITGDNRFRAAAERIAQGQKWLTP